MRVATAHDLAEIDRLIKPPAAPERIYNWLDSQLSVARHYGGCKYQGRDYQIAFDEPGQPLVRIDVLAKEIQMAAKQRASDRAAQWKAARDAQGALL